jgi:hypothetical protein
MVATYVMSRPLPDNDLECRCEEATHYITHLIHPIYEAGVWRMLISSVSFVLKQVPERKEWPKFFRRGVVLFIPMSGKEGFRTPFWLASFWEKTSGMRSGAFHHKKYPCLSVINSTYRVNINYLIISGKARSSSWFEVLCHILYVVLSWPMHSSWHCVKRKNSCWIMNIHFFHGGILPTFIYLLF